MVRNSKNKILNVVVNMMIKGEHDEKVIFSELCHKYGLKYQNAKRNTRNGKIAYQAHLKESEPVEVETIHGKKVSIPRRNVGTVNDPSTETYWSM